MINTEQIRAIAKEIEPRLIQIRRDIHSHPELGLQEERTASWWPIPWRSWAWR